MRNEETREDALERAAQAIRSAEAILIGAGAGMGVDSGLPDFRGSSGFWKAYPPYAKLGLDFVSLASPRWFAEDPELAWGFYGHRLMLYRETQPHDGFAILHRWMSRMNKGGFVYTSNVDGHFQKAGFSPDQVYEVHGSIGAMQCLSECGEEIFSAHTHSLTIDHQTMAHSATLARMPALRRPGKAQYPDVRRLGLELIPCGSPAAANEFVAGHRRGGAAGRGRVWCRYRDPHRPAHVPGRRSAQLRDPDPDQPPRAGGAGRSNLTSHGGLRCTLGSRRAYRLVDAVMIIPAVANLSAS